jgi:hypothetical protein
MPLQECPAHLQQAARASSSVRQAAAQRDTRMVEAAAAVLYKLGDQCGIEGVEGERVEG